MKLYDPNELELPEECEHEYTTNVEGTHKWCQKCDSVKPVEKEGANHDPQTITTT